MSVTRTHSIKTLMGKLIFHKKNFTYFRRCSICFARTHTLLCSLAIDRRIRDESKTYNVHACARVAFFFCRDGGGGAHTQVRINCEPWRCARMLRAVPIDGIFNTQWFCVWVCAAAAYAPQQQVYKYFKSHSKEIDTVFFTQEGIFLGVIHTHTHMHYNTLLLYG